MWLSSTVKNFGEALADRRLSVFANFLRMLCCWGERYGRDRRWSLTMKDGRPPHSLLPPGCDEVCIQGIWDVHSYSLMDRILKIFVTLGSHIWNIWSFFMDNDFHGHNRLNLTKHVSSPFESSLHMLGLIKTMIKIKFLSYIYITEKII